MKKSLTVFPPTLAFWLPLVLWAAASVTAGRQLYELVLAGDRWGAVGLVVLALGSVWALPQGLAGLWAGVGLLIRLAPLGGAAWLGGAIAGGVVVALTLPESDRVQNPERRLTVAEILAALWTIALAWQWGGLLLTYLPPALGPWGAGALGGSLVGLGPQLRSAGLKRLEIAQLLAAAVAAPMGIGALWGALTFRPPAEWFL